MLLKRPVWILKNAEDESEVTIELLKAGLLNGINLKYVAYDWDREIKYPSGSYQPLEKIIEKGIDVVAKNDDEKIVREKIIAILSKSWILKKNEGESTVIIKIKITKDFSGISIQNGVNEIQQTVESLSHSGIQLVEKNSEEARARMEIIEIFT